MAAPQLIVMPVSNIDLAKPLYTSLLGIDPYVDSPYYVGYRAGELEIGLDPNGTVGPLAYWDVDDLETTIGTLVGLGAKVVSEPAEVAPGLRIAVLADCDGNPIGLRHSR